MLNFLYTAVSWVLLQWHHLFSLIGLDEASGLNWALSIIFLVITARLLLFRLFIKQVKYQRQMATLQPEIKKMQAKYKNDKAAQQREMMKLQQEHGFNPLAGCLPLFAQMPVFISLFHVLKHLSNSLPACDVWQYGAGGAKPAANLSLYGFTPTETCNAAKATLFGGAPLAARLRDSTEVLHAMGGTRGITVATILVLAIISAVCTFSTQRLARMGNPVQPEGTAATIQNLMQWLVPLGTLGSALFFPLGVLLYWFTSNSWTMGQQLYVNKFHPHEAPPPPTHDAGKAAAPRPGQRPDRSGKTTVIEATPVDTNAEGPDESTGAKAPRPGQRPAGNANRRPNNQRKKRR